MIRFFLIVFSSIALAAALIINPPWNSSDGFGNKSGMTIHTDNLNGCQYLSRSNSLTPRLDTDGKQICTKLTKPLQTYPELTRP